MSKNRKDYFIKIVFESFETVQTTADKANNYVWGEIGLQVISNALIGFITGRELKDGDDWDWLTIITTPLGYAHVDFGHPEFNPKKSALYGAGWASINFIVGAPWLPSVVRNWGTEFNKKDFAWASGTVLIGYISDLGEEYLANSANELLENSKKFCSGKTVIAEAIKCN